MGKLQSVSLESFDEAWRCRNDGIFVMVESRVAKLKVWMMYVNIIILVFNWLDYHWE